MATHRNRYIKLTLFEEVTTHLQDAKVVGQGSDYLLLERPQPKERKSRTSASPVPRKRRTKAEMAASKALGAGTFPPQVA